MRSITGRMYEYVWLAVAVFFDRESDETLEGDDRCEVQTQKECGEGALMMDSIRCPTRRRMHGSTLYSHG